jgi:hypothetical protein
MANVSHCCFLELCRNISEDVAENEGVVDWYTDFVKPGEDPDAPISDIYYPILDSVDSVRLVGEDNNEELKFGEFSPETSLAMFDLGSNSKI